MTTEAALTTLFIKKLIELETTVRGIEDDDRKLYNYYVTKFHQLDMLLNDGQPISDAFKRKRKPELAPRKTKRQKKEPLSTEQKVDEAVDKLLEEHRSATTQAYEKPVIEYVLVD